MIGYEELLAIFWASHSPTRAPWSRQYRSAIHPHDAEQERVARESLAAEEKRRGTKLYTAIEREAAPAFTYAEDYHQKYQLRHSELGAFFAALYPDERVFTDATSAARANGLAAGYGTADAVVAALPADARPDFVKLTDG